MNITMVIWLAHVDVGAEFNHSMQPYGRTGKRVARQESGQAREWPSKRVMVGLLESDWLAAELVSPIGRSWVLEEGETQWRVVPVVGSLQ